MADILMAEFERDGCEVWSSGKAGEDFTSARTQRKENEKSKAMANGEGKGEGGGCVWVLSEVACCLILITIPIIQWIITTLLHDTKEFFGINLTIIVTIGLIDHLLNLIVGTEGGGGGQKEKRKKKKRGDDTQQKRKEVNKRSKPRKTNRRVCVRARVSSCGVVVVVVGLTDSLPNRYKSS